MLHLCQACKRHVRHTPCPFCGSLALSAVRATPSNASTLSRAQLVAAAALAGTVAACGSNQAAPNAPEPPVDGQLTPAPNNPSTDTTVDAGAPDADTQGVAPIYGAPVALYGAPPESR